MTETDAWDALEGRSPYIDAAALSAADLRNARLGPLAKELAVKTAELEHLDAVVKALKAEVVRYFPEAEGDHSWEDEFTLVEVAYSERQSWDKAELERLFGKDELPDYVKRTLSIDKKRYDALPAGERAALASALTRKLSAARITITPKGPTLV
jgi:hypothetical protein